MSDTENFGYKIVPALEKQRLVATVFSDVAEKYDLMNDLMSFGIHRIWKNDLVAEIAPRSEDTLLDLAGGTGDIAEKFLNEGGRHAFIVDINPDMLKRGCDKRINSGKLHLNIETICASAESLPFEDDTFDYCAISFGMRNITNMRLALREALRVLKPGGKFVCLEFSHIENNVLKSFYDFYSFKILPKIGKIIVGTEEHYQYLVESIRLFPKPQEFANMMESAGFDFIKYRKLTFGIVAIHSGYKTMNAS